jgi:hypothetical protein
MNPNRKHLSLWALLGFLLLGASPALGQISLGSAQSFSVLAGSTITNTGTSAIIGNVGVSPGTSVTGFPPGTITGTLHQGDAVAAQAESDATTAYNAILATACGTDLSGQNLGGLTLTPGVYCFSSSAQLTGILTLNAQGSSTALFIFKIATSLTTSSGSSVQVINSGSACNIFWQVGSSATLGTGTTFVGNILALASITLTTGSSVSGSLLARTGAVTLDTDAAAICAPAGGNCPVITLTPGTLPNGVQGIPYNQTVSGVGGTAPYTFTISSGALPPGLTLNSTTGIISGTPLGAGIFNFTITATDTNGCPGSQPYSIGIAGSLTCPIISLNPATLPPGVLGSPYSQTISGVGGTPPYTFAVSGGSLPPGLTLNTANPGSVILSGTPTMSGLFTFTITATDANGCPGGQTYSIVIPVVSNCPVITVNPATLPAGVVGVIYGQVVSAVGGTAPYTFAVSSGTLPPGLTLSTGNTTSVVISGTPTVAGTFTFTITATDANGCPGSRTYSLVVDPGAGGGGSPPGGGTVPTLSQWGAILMALLIIAAGTFFLASHGSAAMSLAAADPSTAFTAGGKREQREIDWKLLARTAFFVEAGIVLALITLSAKPVDVFGALTSGLLVAFILHLLIGGARRR